MALRCHTARSPSSPRLPMDKLAVARRARQLGDRMRKNRRQLRKKRHSSRPERFILVCCFLRHGDRSRSCRRSSPLGERTTTIRLMKLTLLKSKIHRAAVTGASLQYEGSLTISSDLAEVVDL